MEANVKPGTRCECSVVGNKCHDGGGYGDGECEREAVRMVTVRLVPEFGFGDLLERDEILPMCSACAAYHEARQKERV